jgi:hypothetical protein
LQQLWPFLPQVGSVALRRIRSRPFQPFPNDSIELLNITQMIFDAEIEAFGFIGPVGGIVSRSRNRFTGVGTRWDW